MTNYFRVCKANENGSIKYIQMIVSNSQRFQTDMALCRASRISSSEEDIKALYNTLPDADKAKWDSFTGGSFEGVSIIRS